MKYILAMLICYSISHSQTPTKNFQCLDGTLTDVRLLLNKECAVLGEEGTLILSSDNGITWRNSYLGINDTPTDIWATDDGSIYVVVSKEAVFRSTDKGGTWKKNTSRETVVSLFGNSDKLYGISIDNTVLESKDKGITWQSTIPYNNIKAGFVTGNGNIILITQKSSYYVSKNDGETWSDENFFIGMGQLPELKKHCSNNNYCYLLFGQILITTTDWLEFKTDTLPLTTHSFIVREGSVFIVTGKDSIGEYSTSSKETIWQRPVFNGMPLLYDIAFKGIGILSDNSIVSVGKSKNIIRKTKDEWELVSYIPQYKGSVDFYDDNRGIVGSLRQRFSITTNGGATWNFVKNEEKDSLLNDIVLYVTSVAALPDSVFIAFNESNLLPRISKDNGKMFTEKGILNAPSGNAYRAISADSFYLAGSYPLKRDTTNILLYTEGGKKFQLIKKIYGIASVFHRNAKDFYIKVRRNITEINDPPEIIFNGGYLLHTTDGGKTFDSTESPSKTFPISIYCYEKSPRFWGTTETSDNSNYLYQTEDNGRTFTLKDSIIGETINSIWQDKKTGIYYQSRRQTGIYYSENNGVSWKKGVDIPESMYLFPSKFTSTIVAFDSKNNLPPENQVKLYKMVPDSVHNAVTSVQIEESDARNYSAPVFMYSPKPNPFSKSVRFELIWLSHAQPYETSLIVYNQLGTKVEDISYLCRTIVDGSKKTTLEWTPSNLPDGLYYIEARSHGYSSTRQVIKIVN